MPVLIAAGRTDFRGGEMRFFFGKLILVAVGLLIITAYADNPRPLIGTWNGRATGPQGGPPTGEITVVFKKEGAGLKGTIAVKAAGGAQYSGEVSDVELNNKVFTAKATFRLGENPLEVVVTGPLEGKTIAGTFTVSAKGQKLGDGTFTITKGPAKPASK